MKLIHVKPLTCVVDLSDLPPSAFAVDFHDEHCPSAFAVDSFEILRTGHQPSVVDLYVGTQQLAFVLDSFGVIQQKENQLLAVDFCVGSHSFAFVVGFSDGTAGHHSCIAENQVEER